MELLKLLSTSEIVAQLVSFLLLLVILRLVLWKPFLKVLDDRKNRIASEFKKIEDTQAQVAKLKAQYEDELRSIEQTTRAKLQDAVREGRVAAEDIKKKAREDAEDIIKSANENVKYELSKVKEKLKEEIADLVIRAAEDVIENKLTEENDKKIVYDFLERADRIK